MLKLQIDWIDYGFEVYEPEDVQDKSTNNIWYAIINTDIKLTKI